MELQADREVQAAAGREGLDEPDKDGTWNLTVVVTVTLMMTATVAKQLTWLEC